METTISDSNADENKAGAAGAAAPATAADQASTDQAIAQAKADVMKALSAKGTSKEMAE